MFRNTVKLPGIVLTVLLMLILSGCVEDLDSFNASMTELNTSLAGARQQIQAGSVAAHPSSNSSQYTHFMSKGQACFSAGDNRCATSAFRQARRLSSMGSNDRDFVRAVKALIAAHERTGDVSSAVNEASSANHRVPANAYFANYMRRHGLVPLNLDGSKPKAKSCAGDIVCAINNTPGGTEAAAVFGAALYGAGKVVADACKNGGCTGSNSAPQNSSTSTTESRSPSSKTVSNNRNVARGVKRISPYGSDQYLVECTTRPQMRYWRQGGEWYSGLAGAIGSNHLSIEQLAKRHCGG